MELYLCESYHCLFIIFTFAFQPFLLNVLGQTARNLTIMFAVIGVVDFVTQVLGLDPLRQGFNLVHIIQQQGS